jgi:DNA-binding GntR family transcriptional regulator
MAKHQLIKDPLYMQLSAILRELINSHQYSVGDQFLTERMISERFDVSRVTANKALSKLIDEGTLELRKGIGTFVCDEPKHFPTSHLVSFTHKMLASGKKPSTRVLEFKKATSADVSDEVFNNLNLGAGEKLYYMKRLRLSDDIPLILESHYLGERFCPGLRKEALEGSLFDIMTKEYKLNIAGVDETILSTTIHGENSKHLNLQDRAPGFFMYVIGYNDTKVPVWIANVLFRGDAFELHNRRGPILTEADKFDISIDFKKMVS